MNWEMLTAIGQLATVFIGVPSIIYVAIQLREQTRERRQAAVNALTVQWGDLTKALHEDASLRRFFFAVCSPLTISTPCPNCVSVHFKIVSSRTSRECITRGVKEFLLQSYGAKLSEQ
jgi:hypothetical protein